MSIDVADRLEISEVIARYGHLIDAQEYSRLDEIFTADAIFDLAGYGGARYQGLDAIITLMEESNEHPLAHHSSNIVIDSFNTNSLNVLSKGIGVGYGGKVGSVTYRDVFIHTENGWRISQRNVELRGYKPSN